MINNFQVVHNTDMDLNHFDEVVEGWPIDFYQLGGGIFKSTLTQVLSPEIQLAHVHFNSSVKQEGASIPGYWSFAFPIADPLVWRNYHIRKNDIIIYAPNSPIHAVSHAGFDVQIVSIAESLLKEKLKEKNLENLLVLMQKNPVFSAPPKYWQNTRGKIETGIVNAVKGIHPTEVEISDLLDLLVITLSFCTSKLERVSNIKREDTLAKAEAYIIKNIAEGITVTQVAKFCQTSERTLLYAFKERFGVSTKTFISIMRLNHVYRLLHKNTEKRSVAQVSRQLGFWHMGQFHKDFKDFFGIKASEINP